MKKAMIALCLIFSSNLFAGGCGLTNPLKNMVVTDEFGAPRSYGAHGGTDLRARNPENLFAISCGKVLRAGWLSNSQGYGVEIILKKHFKKGEAIGNDRFRKNTYIVVRYIHMSEVSVKEGDFIYAGDYIGKTGNTGSASLSPHLHVAVEYVELNSEWTSKSPKEIKMFILVGKSGICHKGLLTCLRKGQPIPVEPELNHAEPEDNRKGLSKDDLYLKP